MAEKVKEAYVHDLSPKQQILASCSGAVLTSLMMTPFDVVKVRLQAQQQAVSLCSMACRGMTSATAMCTCEIEGLVPTTHRFHGSVDALFKIIRHEGVPSLWRGTAPAFLMAVPGTVIYFTAYDHLKMKFGFRPGQANNHASTLWAGGVSRTLAVLAICPIELMRTKLQSRTGYNYIDLTSAVRTAVRDQGVLSLWRGLLPMLIRDVPFTIVYWPLLESIKYNLMFTANLPYSPIIPFIASSVAGAVAAVITTPLDVIKTHMQIEVGEGHLFQSKAIGAGTVVNVLRNIVTEHGVRGLFAGLIPRCVKVAPACAVMLTSYEMSKSYFSKQNISHL